MQRALALARRGMGRVEPNPLVGCVLVHGERVVGEGYHRRFGGPHAEVVALNQALGGARGATAYVTLEPCSHVGKTPPCTAALIEAGVARVVAAHGDPFPEVSGRGFQALRRAGIKAQSGLLADEAAELNAPFLTRVIQRRPFVMVKWAQSLDGKIATRTGDSKWISGPEARRYVHQLRARVDAVTVGLRTVLADDPLLNARGVPVKRVATPVVFDSRLSIPLGAALVSGAGGAPAVVLTTAEAVRKSRTKRAALERRGLTVIPCRMTGGRVSVRDALRRLAARDFTNVLVEGGGELIGSLMDARLVDEAYVFTAPVVIGGRDAPGGCAGKGVGAIGRGIAARSITRKVLGPDLLTVARLTAPPRYH